MHADPQAIRQAAVSSGNLMEDFVKQDSIVRRIWGNSDTVLFIFAGAAAEFALNKAVDWLYFTGRLPADPIGRLFSTVTYARKIVFSPKQAAEKAIHSITAIHKGVETSRGAAIPDWAYRDVLFMLIHYSIASFELLERKLSLPEKEEVYNVFLRLGLGMNLGGLPGNYVDWIPVRNQHMKDDLARSAYTDDLFEQYRKHLGNFRYAVLREAQWLVIPDPVKALLNVKKFSWLKPAVPLYKFSRIIHADSIIRTLLLPAAYKKEIDALNVHPS
jgi:hypothetical protein